MEPYWLSLVVQNHEDFLVIDHRIRLSDNRNTEPIAVMYFALRQ